MATTKKTTRKAAKKVLAGKAAAKTVAARKVAAKRTASDGGVVVPVDTRHQGLSLVIMSTADVAGNGIRIVGPIPLPRRLLKALQLG